MILTCPACSARFVVVDSRVDADEREITHAACGAVFSLDGEPVAQAEPAIEVAPLVEIPSFLPQEPTIAEEPAAVVEEAAPIQEAVTGHEGLERFKPALRMAAPAPQWTLHKDDHRRLARQLGRATTVGYQRTASMLAGVGLSVITSVELMLLFHNEIAMLLPGMTHVYSSFGL